MPYNFAADSFHTKKLCSRLSSSEVDFLMKIGRFAFSRPPLGDLGVTYDDHLRLTGKRVVDVLLAIIKLFSLGFTAESLGAKRDRKSAISLQRGQFDPKFLVQGVAPHQIIFAQLVRPMNALQLCADSFHTKKLCSTLSSSEVDFLMKIGRFAFLRPPLGDLGVTYDDHLRLIGKRVVDFLLAIIELFSLGVTASELRAIIG